MSNVHDLISTQRKKFVVLIFESLVERYSRFTQIMEFTEKLAQKNNQSPDDDSVDDALRQLKRLLQFNFSDTVAQIDLGLALGLRYQDNQIPSRVVPSLTNPYYIQPNANQFHVQQAQFASCSKQLPQESNGIDLKMNNYFIQEPVIQEFQELKQTLQNETNSKKSDSSDLSEENPSDQERIKPSKKIFSYFSQYSAIHSNTRRSRVIIERSSYVQNKKQERKFAQYLQDIVDFEGKNNLKTTQKFKEKEFYFLRTQNSQFPVRALLDEKDKAMVIQFQDKCSTLHQTSQLLCLQQGLISRIISMHKENIQSRKKKQTIDSEDDDDDHYGEEQEDKEGNESSHSRKETINENFEKKKIIVNSKRSSLGQQDPNVQENYSIN